MYFVIPFWFGFLSLPLNDHYYPVKLIMGHAFESPGMHIKVKTCFFVSQLHSHSRESIYSRHNNIILPLTKVNNTVCILFGSSNQLN